MIEIHIRFSNPGEEETANEIAEIINDLDLGFAIFVIPVEE